MKEDSAMPGFLCLAFLIAAIIAIAFLASSCGTPISLTVHSAHGSASYSSKSGILITVEK
jgi:hypothetical protein